MPPALARAEGFRCCCSAAQHNAHTLRTPKHESHYHYR